MGDWIEIGKVGTWTAKNGQKVTFTTRDLDKIAGAYNPDEREAPLVFGHPEDNQPAFGWAEKLERAGDIIRAKLKDVPEAVKELVRKKHFKKVSMSLMPDKKTLRHIGLLGAVQPAISGLKDVQFESEDMDLTIEFSTTKPKEEDVEKKELEEKLEKEKKAREKAEADALAEKKKAEAAEKELSDSKKEALETRMDTRVDKLVGTKIQAKDKGLVKKIALSLADTGEEIELSDGAGKKGLDEHLFDFLDGLQDLGLLGEFSSPDPQDQDGAVDMSDLSTRV